MFLLIIFPHTLHIEQFGNGERFQLEYSLCPLVHTDEHDPICCVFQHVMRGAASLKQGLMQYL